MATAAMNLSVPATADDTMEMSSPGRNNLDEDIDFDDFQPETHVNDEDRMMDDGEQTRPATATDDVMEDDVQQNEQTIVQEEVMQDSPSHAQQVEDEELIDYSDDEVQDEIVEDAGAPETIAQPIEAAPETALVEEAVDEEIIRSSDEAAFEKPAENTSYDPAVAEETVTPLATGEEITAPREGPDSGDDGVHDSTTHLEHATGEQHGEEGVIHAAAHDGEQDGEKDEVAHAQATNGDGSPAKPTISLDTSAHAADEGPATPTDTGLHAMTVRFGDLQCPLFKSRNQPDGLLKNDNLASLSLGELIQNCRQRLAIKTGEVLSEDQDLVLSFDQLGLILVEDSRAAFECSLDEVLDVYLQLHRNDETEDIPPFSLHLSLQLKFTSSISVLKQAAAGGSGMSTFGFHHPGEDEQVEEYDEYDQGEHGEEGQEEYDEQYQHDETADGQVYEQTTHAEGSIPEQQGAHTNDYYGAHQEQQTEYPDQEEYYQQNEDYQGELDEGHYYAEDQGEATQLWNDHALDGEGRHEELANAAYSATDDQAAAEEEYTQPSLDAANGEEKPASAATSITFQGDDAQDTTDQTAADQADYSSLLEDNEVNAQIDHLSGIKQQQHDVDQAQGEPNAQNTAGTAQQAIDIQNIGSENYIGDLQEQQYDDGFDASDVDFDAAFSGQDGVYGEDYNQADTSAVQQEAFHHTDHQAGGQAGAAQELFGAADDQHERDTDAQNEADETTLVHPAISGEQHGDTDDFIDFDLDEETTVDDGKNQALDTAGPGSRTALAKRSFEDLAGDEIDFDSPEPKKARAS